jgi:hypothetical protein
MEIQLILLHHENRPLFQAATEELRFPMGKVSLCPAILRPDLAPLAALPALGEIPAVFHFTVLHSCAAPGCLQNLSAKLVQKPEKYRAAAVIKIQSAA